VDASISEGSEAVRPLSHAHRKVGILSPSKLNRSFNIFKDPRTSFSTINRGRMTDDEVEPDKELDRDEAKKD
jgi:hypothetical protein